MNPSQQNSANFHFLTPSQYQDRAVNSLKIHQPSVMLPAASLAFIQHQITSGALYPASQQSLDAIPGRHFGDQFAWPHLQTVFDLYKFDMKDKADRINVIHAALLSILFTLRALFGLEGAWRYWNAIFEAAFGGVIVDYPSGSEPVATLRLGDRDKNPGWDSDFANYGLYVVRTLEHSVDEARAMRYWQQASLLPESSYPRIAIRGHLQLTHELHEGSRRIDGYGDIYDSVVFDVANKNRAKLLAPDDHLNEQTAAMRSIFGDTVADPSRARAWVAAVRNLAASPLGQTPHYPVRGDSLSNLQRLSSIQRYGFVREGGMVHEGLDLPAALGTPVEALYEGEVVAAVDGWQAGGGPRGNYVWIKSQLENGDSFLHEYYHLDSVAEIKRGDRVARGQKIGEVGSTGNSTGPHLHLATRWNRGSSDGRTVRRNTIDPERVLIVGAVSAANEAGLSFGTPDRPHLAVPLFTLGTISGGGYSSPVPAAIAERYAAAVAAERAQGEPAPSASPASPAASAPASGSASGSDKKEAVVQQVRRAAPGVIRMAVLGALVAAGVPVEVAQAAGATIEIVLTENPTGSPEEVFGSVRARVPDWGVPLDTAERHLATIQQALNEYL